MDLPDREGLNGLLVTAKKNLVKRSPNLVKSKKVLEKVPRSPGEVQKILEKVQNFF